MSDTDVAARERLLAAAADLFYREGIRATGTDAVSRAADVSKPTMYRAFRTKETLSLAYLAQRRESFWAQWNKLVGLHDTLQDQLLAVIDYLADRTTTPGYRGCPFMNCAIEFPDADSPLHQSAVSMKREIHDRLSLMCTDLHPQPTTLADELFLLIEGAYAAAHTLGGASGPAKSLSRAARTLLAYSSASV
ncbi:MAG: TetR family transcriptional regulator [Gordonia sp. (in: high G+C Gram-positive bacteria)]